MHPEDDGNLIYLIGGIILLITIIYVTTRYLQEKEMTADKLYDEDKIYKDQMVQAYLEMYGERMLGEVVVCSK